MPNSNQTQTTPQKMASAHAEGGAKKVIEREPPATSHANGVIEGAKEMLVHAKDETAARLHDVRDAATQALPAMGEHARDVAHDVIDRARHLGSEIARDARHAGGATRGFIMTHALPLTVVGAGLGWLAWSMRRATRHPLQLSMPTSRPRAEIEPTRPGMAGRPARPQPPSRERDRLDAAAMTTSGTKLLGVRAREPRLGDHDGLGT